MNKEEVILLNKGKLITANMINDICLIRNNKINCLDDISEIKKQYQILKEEIKKIYTTLPERIALVCADSKGISSISINIEDYTNYRLITEGFDEIFNETYNKNQAIVVNLKENTIQKLYPKINEIDDINSLKNKQIVKKLNENM